MRCTSILAVFCCLAALAFQLLGCAELQPFATNGEIQRYYALSAMIGESRVGLADESTGYVFGTVASSV